MGGVFVKGMEMPKNCHNCELSVRTEVTYGTVYVCQILNEVIGNVMIRQIHCPLVEVPTPHGRLIDADTFENFIRKDWDKNDHWIADVVYSRPTIIPASEEHTMEEFMYGQEGNPNDGSM